MALRARRCTRGCACVHGLEHSLVALGFFRDFLGAARPVLPLVLGALFWLGKEFVAGSFVQQEKSLTAKSEHAGDRARCEAMSNKHLRLQKT
jgi:hypothetical protein